MNFLRSFLKSQSGMSIAEMVVAGALAGGAALGVAALMKNMGGTSKKAEVVIERTELGSALGVFLNSANGCLAFRQSSAIPATEGDFTTPDWTGADGKPKEWRFDGFKNLKGGFELRHNIVNSLVASREDVAGANQIVMRVGGATKTLKKSVIKVKMDIVEKGKAPEDQGETRFEYNIPVMVDANTNSVEFCNESTNLAEACYLLKGSFDLSTGKCSLPSQCESFGAYAVIDCAPRISQAGNCQSFAQGRTAFVNPVTNGYSCPIGSSAISTGGDTWYRDVSCGKKCTARINYSIGYYSCLKCN